jgi:hypothetical protein
VDGSDRGPFREVNAEWGTIARGSTAVARDWGAAVSLPQGQPLRFQLINTGLAAWVASRDRVPGTIWVSASQEGQRTVFLSVPDTTPNRSAIIEWQPMIPGPWTLRAHWLGAGDFGEPLRIVVQ